MDEDFISGVVFFALVALVIWSTEPWTTWQDKHIAYQAVCMKPVSPPKDKPCLEYEPTIREVYKFNDELNQITYWIEERENIPPTLFTSCAVRDDRNWRCAKSPFGAVNMVNGVRLDANHLLLPTVKKWQWYLMEFGVPFKNGRLGSKPWGWEWLDEFLTFPSIWYEQQKLKNKSAR